MDQFLLPLIFCLFVLERKGKTKFPSTSECELTSYIISFTWSLEKSISNYSVNGITSTEEKKKKTEHLVCEVSQSKIKSEAPQMENGKEQDLLYPKTICLQLKDFPDYQFNLCSICD